jgi:hypothetical protein
MELAMSSAAPEQQPRAAKAWEVLEWCRHGYGKMRSNPTAADWVLIWAGTIALLRAVGHVLHKEDAARDARLSKEQRSWWQELNKTKPNPAIFWCFIERDRNKLLKQADLTVGQGLHIAMHEAAWAFDTYSISASGQEPSEPAEQQCPPPCSAHPPRSASVTYSYHMNSGPFVGQDPRDLVRDAIEWWEEQLSDIEQKAVGAP